MLTNQLGTLRPFPACHNPALARSRRATTLEAAEQQLILVKQLSWDLAWLAGSDLVVVAQNVSYWRAGREVNRRVSGEERRGEEGEDRR